MAIASTSADTPVREGERQGFIFHLRPLQLDRIIITAAAALDPKADLGLAILPNPLVVIARIDIGAGVGPSLGRLEWILCVGRGDSRPPARPKLIEPLP